MAACSAAHSVHAVKHNEEFRGDQLKLVCDTALWGHEKKSLTPAEMRNKQALWEFFIGLPPDALQKVHNGN